MSENGENSSLSDREKSLLDDNINLKTQLKELETTFNKMQADFTRSIKMRERLDSLCKVLQKQTQEIKDESSSQIEQAEGQGNQLAREVSDNMHLMENVNQQLGDIMNESLQAKQRNTDLTGEVAELKKQYDDRHEVIMKELQAANDDLIKTKTELATLRLKAAEDRENIYGEMHKLANTLVENRHQMKNAKELELELRQMLQSYEAKFSGLQGSLEDTNNAYNSFTGEMERVQSKTKEFEQETLNWQKKWDVNNAELTDITNKHESLQNEISKVHESLMKMTSLYQSLETEKYLLMKKLGRNASPSRTPKTAPETTLTPKQESKPKPKQEPKPKPKQEPTPAPQQESTPAPQQEPTPAPKQEPTPAPKQETTPAPKQEPTPAPKQEPTPPPKQEPKQQETKPKQEPPKPKQEPSKKSKGKKGPVSNGTK